MNDNCAKCKINLSEQAYKNIKIRDSNQLAIKLLFSEISSKDNLEELGYCDLCGATFSEIILDYI